MSRRSASVNRGGASRALSIVAAALDHVERRRPRQNLNIAAIGPIMFHSLRRTYASLRCACGGDVAYTSARIGHEDARFTLRVYTGATKRRERLSGPHLKAYDAALDWPRMGTSVDLSPAAMPTKATKSPVNGAS
jgi:integrase